jgi:hypothetical protein
MDASAFALIMSVHLGGSVNTMNRITIPKIYWTLYGKNVDLDKQAEN